MVYPDRCSQYKIVIKIKHTDQMPSLNMKTKLTTGCLKEKNGLHVCRKSSTISKNSSHSRVRQDAKETSSCTLSNLDALDKVNGQELGRYKANHGLVRDETGHELVRDETDHDLVRDETDHDKLTNDEDKVLRKLSSTFTDSATENTESTSSKFSSNIETIFSPILESMDILDNSGGSDDLYMPQLDTEDSDDGSRSSCEYQACNISDFYISDIIFSGAPNGSNSQFDSKTDSVLLPDYRFDDSRLLCDLSEEYMVLPFLEDNLSARHDFDGKPSEETIDAENSSFYGAIHQLKSCNQDSQIYASTDQDHECFDPQMYIRSFPDQPDVAPFTLLPTTVSNKKPNKEITLVLDLDETLVHSTLEHCDDADFSFSVYFNMKEHTVYVKQRPHLQTFLKRVAELFEIVVFTASQSIYAKQLLDILDPDGNIISRRAYRESCIFSDGCYLKDLTVLGVDLAKVAIVDNSPQVFKLQVNNGIPITSWFDDPSDCALIALLPFLESLVDIDDVRPAIATKFGNKE